MFLSFYRKLSDASDKKIKIFEGSENFYRDFIFIEGMLKIIDFFIENKISGIFNAGTGEVNTFFRMAEIIKTYFYDKIEIETIPFPEDLQNKYQKFTKADLSKLTSIGFQPSFLAFKEAIYKYFDNPYYSKRVFVKKRLGLIW